LSWLPKVALAGANIAFRDLAASEYTIDILDTLKDTYDTAALLL